MATFRRSIYPGWNKSVLKAPDLRSKLMKGDLSGFLHAPQSEFNKVSIYQKRAFDDINITEIEKLFEGENPVIFPLLQECLELSIQLFLTKFAKFFFPAEVLLSNLQDELIQNIVSTYYAQNSTSVYIRQNKDHSIKPETLKEYPGLAPNYTGSSLIPTIAKARQIHRDEYALYDAAVAAFQYQLSLYPQLPSEKIDACQVKIAESSPGPR